MWLMCVSSFPYLNADAAMAATCSNLQQAAALGNH